MFQIFYSFPLILLDFELPRIDRAAFWPFAEVKYNNKPCTCLTSDFKCIPMTYDHVEGFFFFFFFHFFLNVMTINIVRYCDAHTYYNASILYAWPSSGGYFGRGAMTVALPSADEKITEIRNTSCYEHPVFVLCRLARCFENATRNCPMLRLHRVVLVDFSTSVYPDGERYARIYVFSTFSRARSYARVMTTVNKRNVFCDFPTAAAPPNSIISPF